MKEPKTIKGYISMIKFIEKIVISDKIGFDELSETEQYALIELSAEISNRIKDIDAKINKYHGKFRTNITKFNH